MSTSARAGSVNSRACSTVTPGISPTVSRTAPVPAGEHLAVHLVQELVDPRPADVGRRPVAERRAGQRRAVVQVPVGGDVLGDHVDDVHAEAVDPAVEPPPHHRVDRVPDLGVLPVQVGLLAGEQVQVVLAGRLVELPGRAGEERLPVGRLGARIAGGEAAPRRPPPVPVALRGVRRRTATRSNHGCSSLVWLTTRSITSRMPRRCSARDQLVELRQRAEQRVDVLVVADVVAVVGLRRGVDRREPQDVDAEVGSGGPAAAGRRRGRRRRRRRSPGTSGDRPGRRRRGSTRAGSRGPSGRRRCGARPRRCCRRDRGRRRRSSPGGTPARPAARAGSPCPPPAPRRRPRRRPPGTAR